MRDAEVEPEKKINNFENKQCKYNNSCEMQ